MVPNVHCGRHYTWLEGPSKDALLGQQFMTRPNDKMPLRASIS
jgi:hypothetical protein